MVAVETDNGRAFQRIEPVDNTSVSSHFGLYSLAGGVGSMPTSNIYGRGECTLGFR